MLSSHRIVIAGASIAGLTTAESLRQEGFEGEIILLGDERHLPYMRPPLSKQLLSGEWEPDRAAIKTKAELENLEIQFHGSSPALKLDLKKRVVVTPSGPQRFDDLVIATGARARQLSFGSVRTLRTLDDAVSLSSDLHLAKKVIVIGTGVLGSEISSSARALGSDVVMIGQSAGMSFGSVGQALSPQICEIHEDNGVGLRLDTNVIDVISGPDGVKVRLETEEEICADLAVAAIGAIACTEWLRGSGLTVSDGVVCGHNGLAAPGVYAVGDVAAWRNPATGSALRMQHQTSAIEQAMTVAGVIVKNSTPKYSIPFFWSEIHKVSIKAYGWFEGGPLTEIRSQGNPGLMFSAHSKGDVTGVVSLGSSLGDFRTARALVDESSKKLYVNR